MATMMKDMAAGAKEAVTGHKDAQAEYGESKEHNKGAAKGHAVSAMDEAKAGMSHAKDQVASKFTKNKAEADDKVHNKRVDAADRAAPEGTVTTAGYSPNADVKADAKADEKAHKEAAKDHGAGFVGEAKAAMGHAKDAVGDKLQSKKHEGYATAQDNRAMANDKAADKTDAHASSTATTHTTTTY